MINDDELLLYYYRDGLDAAERARIGAAIAADPLLAQRLYALVARLDAVAALPEVAVPEPVEQRWRDALARASSGGRAPAAARRILGQPRWQLMAAAAGIVGVIVALQVMRAPDPVANDPVARVHPGNSGEDAASAYEHGLKFHLASTERELARLGSASPEERARMIDVITGQNRLYALAAERAGEPQLARVLRAFNPILEDLANDRSESTAADLSQLSFELRAMQARLGADAAAPIQPL